MLRKLFPLILLVILSLNSYAQYLSGDMFLKPADAANFNAINKAWSKYQRSPEANKKANEQVFVLPVVFHVIHQNGPENLSDAEVIQALQTLNDGFANANFYDQGSGINTNITFCLAHVDPDGNYSTGINHVFADLPHVIPLTDDGLLKSFIDWDPTKYINIWVVKDIQLAIEANSCGGEDVDAAGYATLPISHGSTTDGIVLEAASINSTVIIHEMGHYLGLLHPFQGGCINNDCTIDGDGICDTPPQQQADAGCNNGTNSCHTDAQSGFATDQNDVPFNFMDYTQCAHNFTPGQKDRMRFTITNTRNSLLTQDVCTSNCSSAIDAVFAFPYIEYKTGDNIVFTPSSANPVNEWSINNSFISSSATLNYIFPSQGWYKIELLAKPSPDDPQCRNNAVNYVHVYCAIKPTISVDKIKVAINENVHFASTTTVLRTGPENINYKWYYNDTLVSNASSFDYGFQFPGIKVIYLVTQKGACTDTSNYQLVDVKPLPDYTISIEGITCDTVSREIKFSICNQGYFDLAPGLPVSFYDADPTTANAHLIGNAYTTDAIVGKFCCVSFKTGLPSGFQLGSNYIYAVVNDDGSLGRPYSFSQFPVTTFGESDYTNNLDSLPAGEFILHISPQDTAVLSGTSIVFTATLNSPAGITWRSGSGTFSCDTCSTTNFMVSLGTKVIATATNSTGCTTSDTANVHIFINGDIWVPNAFTPNKDGLNDIFYIIGSEQVRRINLLGIYNRLGQKIFEKVNFLPNDPSLGWDGTFKEKPLSTQVFVYYFTVDFIDGTHKAYKGALTLIR